MFIVQLYSYLPAVVGTKIEISVYFGCSVERMNVF